MLSNYLPILIFLIVAAALAAVLLTLGTGLGRYFARFHDDRAKLSPYECGFEAFEDSAHEIRRALLPGRDPVHRVRPGDRVPVSLGGRARQHRARSASVAMAIFLGILVVGFIYEWKKGALEWD